MRILLIDDDPLVLSTMRTVLELDGHDVVSALGGRAGIDAFEAEAQSPKPFTVVVTDLGMPGVDGRQVASAIKKRSSATPVVLLTGWGERADGKPNGTDFDRILAKPPRIRDLREVLKAFSAHDESPPAKGARRT